MPGFIAGRRDRKTARQAPAIESSHRESDANRSRHAPIRADSGRPRLPCSHLREPRCTREANDKLQHEYALTLREGEVLYWLSCGKANRDIADILGMSPRTVNKHLEHIYETLGAEARGAAVSMAMRALRG